MPVTITTNAAERVRYTVISGDVTGAELVEAFGRAAAAPEYDPSVNGLVDMRGVERLDVASSAIWDLAQLLRRAERGVTSRRVAIVAPSDFVFGMARMFEALAATSGAKTTYHIFRDMAEARAWLGLAADDSSQST